MSRMTLSFHFLQLVDSMLEREVMRLPYFPSHSWTSCDSVLRSCGWKAYLCPTRSTSFACFESFSDEKPIGSLCLCNGAGVVGFLGRDRGLRFERFAVVRTRGGRALSDVARQGRLCMNVEIFLLGHTGFLDEKEHGVWAVGFLDAYLDVDVLVLEWRV